MKENLKLFNLELKMVALVLFAILLSARGAMILFLVEKVTIASSHLWSLVRANQRGCSKKR